MHVVRGHTKLHSANQFVDLRDGDTFIMKTDNFISNWQPNEDGSFNKVIVFQLTSDVLKHLYGQELPSWFVQFDEQRDSAEVIPKSPILGSFFENLQIYLNNPSHLSEEVVEAKMKELISIIVQTSHSDTIKQIFGNLFKPNEYAFQEVVQKNLFEDLNIEDLAFLAGMSLSSFKRKFNAVYGTTPNKYITSKRLEKAQSLLRFSDMLISEVAYDCGFSDVGYFSKLFKKYYNYSPSEVKKGELD